MQPRTLRKDNTSNNKKEKEVYIDGSKNSGKKVGLAAVFGGATRRGGPTRRSLDTHS